jgi:hypothetical protein
LKVVCAETIIFYKNYDTIERGVKARKQIFAESRDVLQDLFDCFFNDTARRLRAGGGERL